MYLFVGVKDSGELLNNFTKEKKNNVWGVHDEEKGKKASV